jgi:hypothetical protein
VDRESVAVALSEDYEFRSSVVRELVRCALDWRGNDRYASTTIPKRIIQFWDDPFEVPDDVGICMDSWQALRSAGFVLARFDDSSATRFVADNLGSRHLKALAACYHPAMRSDYFRLCYISLCGGCYVDADDVYNGQNLDMLFADGRLKLHPLCIDALSRAMVPSAVYTRSDVDSKSWIFYFNNNPLIAPAEHPIILRALERSTAILTGTATGQLPEIQSTTGPGNLTASLVAQALICDETDTGLALMVIPDWEGFATSVWPLSYRADARNWRLSNRKHFLR